MIKCTCNDIAKALASIGARTPDKQAQAIAYLAGFFSSFGDQLADSETLRKALLSESQWYHRERIKEICS